MWRALCYGLKKFLYQKRIFKKLQMKFIVFRILYIILYIRIILYIEYIVYLKL